MQVKVGSYVGTGSSQSIVFGFQPTFVLIKGGANVGCIRVSAMTGDNTKPVTGNTAFFTGGITSLDATGFTVGTNAQVNANGTTYYYVAVGGSDIFSGSYVGTGAAGNAITGVGFAPNAVLCMANNADRLTYRTTAHSDGQAWDAAEAANLITSLDADGFTVGSRTASPSANVNATTYYYVALRNVVGLFHASLGWTGDGANPRTITGVGFSPLLAMSKRRNSTSVMVGKHASESGANSLIFDGSAELTTIITALAADGFTSTADARVNANANTYAGLFFYAMSATLAGDSTMTVVGSVASAGSATLAGTGSLSVVVTYTSAVSAVLDGTGELTVVVTYTSPASAVSFSGTGSLTVSGSALVSGIVELRGEGQLIVTPNGAGVTGAVIFVGQGYMTILAQPAVAPPAPIAPYGEPDDISVHILNLAGGFIFEAVFPSTGYPLEDLEITRALPGGDETATFTTQFHAPFQLVGVGSRVEISDLAGIFWLGFVDSVDVTYWQGGATLVVHCLGYGATADDQVYLTRQVFPAGTTAAQMFIHARDRLCPDISGTNNFIAGSAYTPLNTETKNLRGDSAQSVFNFAASLGSAYSTFDPLIWGVRAPMNAAYPAGVPILEVYAVPDAPTLTIDLDDGYTLTTKIERQQVRNHIIVNYGTGSGSGSGDPLHTVASSESSTQLAEAFSYQGWADMNFRERQMWIDASSEWVGNSFVPQRIADSVLAKYGRVHLSGQTTMVPFDGTGAHPILVNGGPATVPVWRVPVGYRLIVSNTTEWIGLPSDRDTLITRTRFSMSRTTKAVQITTGVLSNPQLGRQMTGLPTLRQLAAVPPLSRPNRPEEWQRSTIQFEMDAQDDPGFLIAQYPHILRTIDVFAIVLDAETGGFRSVEVIVGEGSQSAFPSYNQIARTTVASRHQQVASGLSRHAVAGDVYTFYARNANPDGVRVLIALGVDRVKVVE